MRNQAGYGQEALRCGNAPLATLEWLLMEMEFTGINWIREF